MHKQITDAHNHKGDKLVKSDETLILAWESLSKKFEIHLISQSVKIDR